MSFCSWMNLHLLFEGKVYSPLPKNAADGTGCQGTAPLRSHSANPDGKCRWRLFVFYGQKTVGLAAGRDPVGVQPLYYGENKDIAAFATNRKALWKLGIENPLSFPPGNMAFVNREGFQFKPIKTLALSEPAIDNVG